MECCFFKDLFILKTELQSEEEQHRASGIVVGTPGAYVGIGGRGAGKSFQLPMTCWIVG